MNVPCHTVEKRRGLTLLLGGYGVDNWFGFIHRKYMLKECLVFDGYGVEIELKLLHRNNQFECLNVYGVIL